MNPHFGHTKAGLPVHLKTTDHLTAHGAGLYKRINAKFAIWATAAVGSMTCAWLFAALAVAGLNTAMKPGNIGLLFWFSSDFLQLTLLSVIMVGQNIAALAADARAAKTFEDAEVTKSNMDLALDLLDTHTQGGITEVLDAIAKLSESIGALADATRAVLTARNPAAGPQEERVAAAKAAAPKLRPARGETGPVPPAS